MYLNIEVTILMVKRLHMLVQLVLAFFVHAVKLMLLSILRIEVSVLCLLAPHGRHRHIGPTASAREMGLSQRGVWTSLSFWREPRAVAFPTLLLRFRV